MTELQKALNLVIRPNSFKWLQRSQRRLSGFLRDRQLRLRRLYKALSGKELLQGIRQVLKV